MNNHDVIDQIRRSVDIVEVISDYLPLVSKGKNYFGVCPFHDDTNPSMSVSRDKQIYKCFSCGASGNVYNFLMDYEHISFKEALAILSDKTGIKLEGIKIKSDNKYDDLYKLYDLTNKFYQNNLSSNLGKKALSYLESRKITLDLIKEFEIGLSLGDNGLTKLLTSKKTSIEQLETIGLSNNGYDTFNSRITFPLKDISNHIVGFSGRIYDDSSQNKYLNTKETVIFKKGLMLYNYSNSKEYIRTTKNVIVMEGFMDVIRAFSVDIKNTIALMGTAMTKEQASLIKRLATNVILCFDGDNAGMHATSVNADILDKLGCNVKVVELFDSYDPDTFIIEKGQEAFASLIKNAINYQDYKIKVLKQGKNLTSIEEKTEYINLVLNEICKVTDNIKIELLLKSLAKEVEVGYNTLEKRMQELRGKTNLDNKIIIKNNPKKRTKEVQAMNTIIYNMFDNDLIIRYYDKKGIIFNQPNAKYLAMEILSYYKKNKSIYLADFLTYLSDKEELLNYLKEILSFEYPVIKTQEDLLEFISCLSKEMKEETIKNLRKQLSRTSVENDKEKILEEIINLKMGS
ncbi:MAG: DNA primase [Bacilli bacterium]